MATNDTILIDGILDDIISSNGMDDTNENRGKAFEDFAISELQRHSMCSATSSIVLFLTLSNMIRQNRNDRS